MTFDFKKYRDELLFVPLGGSNEIGMNLNLYTYQGKWIMVDCGIGFAGEYLPGVEIIVPDVSFVTEIKKDLLGLILTHAHEDHLGAVPYVWNEFECPIYATPFTAEFLKHKLGEMGAGRKPKITQLPTSGECQLGPFSLELVDLTHSIPEMQALAIKTDKGVIMHTGDWKFDAMPLVGPVSDYDTLKKYGDGKVLAMVCDSTNVFDEGESGSESDVRKNLVKLIAECPQRVVVTTFASNLARVLTIVHAAHEAGRVVGLAGRSLWRIVETAKACGYIPESMEFIPETEIMNIGRSDIVIICTGGQGEPRAALPRIAKGEHPNVRLAPGDVVVFSSRKIPGNESKINWMFNKLSEKKIELITGKNHHIHVSGHPARGELKRMYELVRPQIAVPTHGETRHLHEHAKFAKSLGVPETVEAFNGAVVWLESGEASVIGKVDSGYTAIDGNTLIPTDGEILRARRRLRDDGIIIVSFALDKKNHLASNVQLTAPGVLDPKEDMELLESWTAEVESVLEHGKGKSDDNKIKETVRGSLRKLVKNDLGKKPLVEVLVSRI
jgi:ribonuclease J